MEAYEKMRGEMTKLLEQHCGDLSLDQVRRVLTQLDVCAAGYSIVPKSQELAVLEDGIPEVVRIYLAVKRTEGLSAGTLKVKFYRLRSFFAAVRRPIGAVTANDIRAWLMQYQQRHGIAGSTLDGVRVVICSFFHWAAAEGYIDRDISLGIRPIRFEKKQRRSLSQVELEYIRQACRDARDRAMVEFFYSTGCRVSELGRVRISDVNFLSGEVALFGKGSKHRTSYLNAKARVTLQDYLATRTDGQPWLFVGRRAPHGQLTKAAIEKAVRILVDRTGGRIQKHVTPHVFRHTTATQAVASGMPINEVQRLLGHSNIATTMIYVETNDAGVKASHLRSVI